MFIRDGSTILVDSKNWLTGDDAMRWRRRVKKKLCIQRKDGSTQWGPDSTMIWKTCWTIVVIVPTLWLLVLVGSAFLLGFHTSWRHVQRLQPGEIIKANYVRDTWDNCWCESLELRCLDSAICIGYCLKRSWRCFETRKRKHGTPCSVTKTPRS